MAAPDESTQLEPELVQLGDFRLGRLLGAGGMGAVYEAEQIGLERRVAVKILKKDLAGDAAFVERFRREAKVAASLVHRNLVKVFKVGEQDGVLFFAMEFVDGVPVSDLLRKGKRLEIAQALRIVSAVAEALRAGQLENVIHRDIKPENIMLTEDGEVKLGDLGLAKRIGAGADVTKVGEVMGTPHYMAPEQSMNTRDVDHRADIYSLGISLFHMVTGRRPFAGKSPLSVAMAHAQDDLPSPSQWGMEIPAEVERLIDNMAAKSPDARFQTYDELIDELDRATDICGEVGRKLPGNASGITVTTTRTSVSDGFQTPVQTGAPTAVGFVEQSSAWMWLGLGSVWVLVLWWGITGPARTPMPSVADVSPATNSVPIIDPGLPNDGRGAAVTLGITRPLLGQVDTPPLPMVNSPTVLPRPIGVHESDASSLAKARHYAEIRPWAITRILAHYDQIWREAYADETRDTVEQEAAVWVERLETEIKATIRTNSAQMKQLLSEGRPRMAYDVWRNFEPRLRTPKYDWEIYRLITNHIPVRYRRAESGYVPVPGPGNR